MDSKKVRRLRTLLSLHFAIIAVLTTMLVSNGSGSVFLPVFILLISAVSLVVVDVTDWFGLDRVGIFLGMTVGTGVAIGNYIYSTLYEPSESGQLYAVAGLLVFPEAVLFLQRKNLRVFEQLAIFLLLEIMVAALVNDNLLFGLMLLPIVLLWVSSLVLFSTYATWVQIAPDIEVPMPKLAELLFAKLRKSIMGVEKKNPLIHSRLVQVNTTDPVSTSLRALQSTTFGLGAIAFAIMFFYLLPRTTTGGFRPRFGDQIQVGLPENVTLGQVGRALKDPTAVMRLKLTQAGKPYKLKDPPYVRARVYDLYDPVANTWFLNHSRSASESLSDPESLATDATKGRDHVDIEFDLLRTCNIDTFTFPPACLPRTGVAPECRVHRYTQLLHVNRGDADDGTRTFWQEEAARHPKPYRLGSMGFSRGEQLDITPILPDKSDIASLLREHQASLLDVEFRQFPQVDALRQRILREANVADAESLRIAKAIENFFARGTEFSYTLDQKHIDETIDPLEDFVTNIKAGSCQYFATTMLTMLRQSGIASRLVLGYHPSELNKHGQYFFVRQSDAHAWVEARFTSRELKGTEYEKWIEPDSNYWIRFDPTAERGDSSAIVEQPNSLQDYAEKLWKGYVLEGRELTGPDSAYAPVVAKNTEAYKQLAVQWQQFKDALASGRFGTETGSIGFAWPLAALVFAIGSAIVFLWQLSLIMPRFAPKLARRLGIRNRQADFKQEFFARCVNLLKRLGFERNTSQTPQEMTRQAAEFLADQQGLTGSRDWLQLLTLQYYRLRFGNGVALTEDEQVQVQTALRNLEKGTSQVKARGS